MDLIFSGSSSFLDKHDVLLPIVGSGSWFSEFRPVLSENITSQKINSFHIFLFRFFSSGLCCFLTGTFVYSAAGIFNSFDDASIFIIVSNHHLLDLIFQRFPMVMEIFYFDSFKFQFLNNLPESYVFNYMVKDFDTDFSIMISFYGVPSRARCNYRSNVDLVHFIWDDFEQFNLNKYAITILPADDASTAPLHLNQTSLSDTKLLCLQHYRAASDGWRDEFKCENCVTEFMSETFHLCKCRTVWDCDCKVCRRQPPSFRNICSSIVFRSSFQLTPYTTFEQYAYGVENGFALVSQVLPPEFPVIRLFFRYDSFDRKLHRDCPGEGSWHARVSREFRSEQDAILALKNTSQKHTFWCSFCDKGLFSLINVTIIPRTKRKCCPR